MMFLDCPAYLDRLASTRCGLPAEIEGRYTLASTDGPLESAKIRCPRGHWFNGPDCLARCAATPIGMAPPGRVHIRTRTHRTRQPLVITKAVRELVK